MNRRLLLIFSAVFIILVLISPTIGLAAETGGGPDTGGRPSSSGESELPNPLGKGLTDPRAVVGNIIKALLGIVGSLALAVFIFGGFMWVTSAGNEEKVKKGKDMLMWAAFGLAVIFASYALVTFVIDALTGGGTPPT